ncbi:transposase [Bacillus carboniphilus]|uniref:Transposase n=1 Tax=Bacillus carboniphilus TaxID=86663 RepID=A0ABY9JSD1_9BACI|nr:transposase [Bacillus carboniphilus]WLR41398.1 transposase [Bacillus carboniphilus]
MILYQTQQRMTIVIMWKRIDKELSEFRTCFTRQATYEWFVVMIIGLMLRSDQVGLTSIIRELSISPKSYPAMMHFFRSQAWKLEDLIQTWTKLVYRKAPIYKKDGITILVGDGVKQSKEARKMPGVKRLHQESENSSKAEFIFGHMFGGIGVLIGDPSKKLFCLPLSIRLHDGVNMIRNWRKKQNNYECEGSHIVQIINDAFQATKMYGRIARTA